MRHVIDSQGMRSIGSPDGSSPVFIPHLAATASVLQVSSSGQLIATPTLQVLSATVGPVSADGFAPYEYYRHSTTQSFTNADHTQFFVNGQYTAINGGMTRWNTGSSIFYPHKVGAVYLMRLEGEISPVGGNPIFHVDFVVSGTDPTVTTENFRHKQTVEVQVRNTAPHQHLHGVFMVFTDADLYVSGGLFLATTTAGTITITTASLMIAAI